MVRISNSRSKNGKTLRKRLEILRGAAGAFRRDGFERAGMREIARAVEMSPAGLYHYFRTKHEILYFCQDYSLDRMLEAAGRVRRRREPADVKLRRLIMAQMTCMLDELQGTAAHAEFSSLPARLLGKVVRKRDRYERLMRGVIEGGVRAKIFRPCDPKLVTLAILGAINWTIKWYRPDGARGANEIAGEFADYLVRGLKR